MNTSTSNRGVISFLAIIAITACLSRQLMARAAEDKCIKDYTQPCAEGWAESSVLARVCEAPISYYGPCTTNVAFMDTKEDKIKLEEMCHIKWPCFCYCREDDLTGCPKFWYLEDGFCKPSAGYHGRCSEPADLTKMHETERTLWGNRCGVQWPCKTKCKNNYKAKCPEGWQPTDNGKCVAPESYNGPCFGTADLSFFNETMKQQFGTVCGVTFPCSK